MIHSKLSRDASTITRMQITDFSIDNDRMQLRDAQRPVPSCVSSAALAVLRDVWLEESIVAILGGDAGFACAATDH